MPVDTVNAPANTSIACIPRVVMNCALPSDKLNICHINIQSLCARNLSKFNELKLVVLDSKLDIVCISETWLTENISDEVIAIEGFNLIRNDRLYSQGGGICIYYKKYLKCKILSHSNFSNILGNENRTEFMFVEVQHRNSKFLLGTVYNPPRNDCSEILYNQLDVLSLSYTNMVLVGDFNTDLRFHSSQAMRLDSAMNTLGLTCVSFEPTHFYSGGCSLIDLMLTNKTEFVLNFNQVSAPGFSKHDIIFASLDISRDESAYQLQYYRDYKNIDLIGLGCATESIDWSLLYSISDPDIALDFLNQRLIELYDYFVPLKVLKPKKNPWFNNEIQAAMIERNIAYGLWISSRDPLNFIQYKRLRNKVTQLIHTAKANYMSSQLNAFNSSKDLWRKLKHINVVKSGNNNDQFENSSDEINEYFGSNFIADNSSLPVPLSNDNGFKFSLIAEHEVVSALYSIKSNAIGLDGIPLQFVKILLPHVVTQICFIFNLCLRYSKYPRAWKAAKVIPIKKKQRNLNLSNLRPISILCGLSKVFEKILKNQIQEFITSFNLLSGFQSGFRSGHSTTTAFLKVHDDVSKIIDSKGIALLLLIDFSKAFDRVSHNKLLRKLSEQFYFSCDSVRLVQSYLSNRSQVVSINGDNSGSVNIVSGVPQGSILGPLLFSLYINDLSTVLKFCKLHMFADDVQIYLCSTNLTIDEMVNLLNDDLRRVYAWSIQNLLPVNIGKTNVMLISRNRSRTLLPDVILGQHTVEYIDKCTNLGFILTSDLDWDSHVNSMCCKVYNVLRHLWLTSSMLKTEIKLKLFKSLVLPHFVYGAEFILNASARAMDRLRVALNSCVRYVFNLNRYDRVSHLQKQLLGCSFQDFFKLRVCLTLFKIIKFSSPLYLKDKLQAFQSQRARNFIIPQYNTSHYGNTLFVRGIVYWNSLPNDIKNNNSVSGFRQDCMAWFNRGNQQNF